MIISDKVFLGLLIRCFLDSQTACKIYRSMIVTFVTNYGISSQSGKLTALHVRALRVIGRNSKECNVVSPERANTKRACVLVHKIINNDICVALQCHFKRHAHNKTTRNNR